METLFSIITALQPQELITKIDLKDAYHHILVNHNIWKFFRFMISRKTCQFASATVRAIDGTKRVHQNVGSGSPVIEKQRDQSSC